MAEYLILIYEDENAYATASPDVFQEVMEAHNRFAQRFAGLDHPARQSIEAGARTFRTPRHQHMPVADDCRRDRQIRPVGIHAGVWHDYSSNSASTVACCSPVVMSSECAIS